MHIIVTNDDGIQAPGLLALAHAMQELGQITILAPERNWSICGHVKTMDRPLRVREISLNGGIPALACDGAPSDCIALACLGLLDEPFDLVVSGINPYANLSLDLTYSGTVAAAMEAAVWGHPALAFSLNGTDANLSLEGYQTAAKIACQVVKTVLQKSLPPETLLNVNIPNLPNEQIKGIRISRHGKRIYNDFIARYTDPRGQPLYWIGGKLPTGVLEEGTDIGDLAAGYVSINPVHLDLTAHHLVETLKDWSWAAD